MKQFINVVNYIMGGFFNICFVLAVLFLIYTMTLKGVAYGKKLVEEETTTKPSKEVTVSIPQDATAEQIGEILEESGLVSNKYLFWFQSRLNGTYNLFKSGEYKLDMSMSSGEIMDILQQEQYAEQSHLTITIAEGLNLKQIGSLAESKDFFTEQEFLDECAAFSGDNYSFLENLTERPNRLEGYLFPDTYYLPEGAAPSDLIIRMLNRFEEVTSGYESQADEMNLTLDNVITMASIIEKEVRRQEERGFASSVIYNRLGKGMPLEMCSTVMYVLDKRKDRLLYEDLEIESPYNTYITKGLPAGPICNPGRASIEAALNPKETDYLYFVVKDDETGEHVFTSDFDEFLEAKELYNQKF